MVLATLTTQAETMFLVLTCGVGGLGVGSFLNVVIWRVPRDESVASPRSHCPACSAPIRWYDNIPVVSWIALGRRCRICRAPISIRYPAIEAGCAALFVVLALAAPRDGALPAVLVLGATMLALSMIDVEHHRLPDSVLVPGTLLAIALYAVAATLAPRWDDFARAIGGGALAFAILLVIHQIAPGGLGLGDVKLAFACGLLLGWRGLGFVPIGLLASFALGALFGVVLIATGRLSRQSRIPFGPFLSVGAVGVTLWGGPIIDWYRGG